MSKYAKRCCSEVNENIFERTVNFAADAWRARAVASSIRPRSNSSVASRPMAEAVSGCSAPRSFCRVRSAFWQSDFGSGVLAHALVQQGQVIGGSRCIGMFSAKELLLDLERLQ